jgi:hypothetical protein
VPLERLFREFRADLSSSHQPPSHQEQVAKREQREELGTIFGKAAVTGLHVAKRALDDPEGMLDFGPDHGDDAVDLRINRVKVTALRCLTHHTPEFALILERRLAFGADIAFVGPDRSFLAVQKLIPDLAVMNFCRRRIEAVGHPAVHIHADVCFHPEIPVISLLGG